MGPFASGYEKIFTGHKFIPVVTLNDAEKAIPLAKALLAAGISIMEVTLRTQNALVIIKKIATEVPEMLVGAGTVLTNEQYHLAVKHKAQFIVAPGLSPNLVEISHSYSLPFIPGVVTPSEIMQAISYGFTYLKFFPAESYNGYATLKALASPFSQVKFCPTGGINLNNARQYLSLPNVVSVGCSFFVAQHLIASNDFNQITALAKQAIKLLND